MVNKTQSPTSEQGSINLKKKKKVFVVLYQLKKIFFNPFITVEQGDYLWQAFHRKVSGALN